MATYDRRDSFYVELENSELMASGREHSYGFTDFVTKGVPLTLASVVNSFANTPAAVGRMFGADTKDWVEMEDYGFSQNTLNYYEDNKAAIDTAALIGGSFIPGLASIKALKMAQAYGKTTPGIARLLGYTSRGKDLAVDAAHAEIAKGSLSMTGALNAAKYRAVAYGFGEQALQAATWELATSRHDARQLRYRSAGLEAAQREHGVVYCRWRSHRRCAGLHRYSVRHQESCAAERVRGESL
jgi:hypothetical protein